MAITNVKQFEFTHDEITNHDFTRFDRFLNSNNSEIVDYLKLPNLKGLQGTVDIFVQGYTDNPNPIYLIPELRSFFSSFWMHFPFWFYFITMNNSTLRFMFLCRIYNIQAVTEVKNSAVGVTIKEVDSEFYDDIRYLKMACAKASMTDDEFEVLKKKATIYLLQH